MPNSLRARLKNLVHKGVLTQKDFDRIEIIPANKTERALKAAKVIKKYCKSIGSDCKTCIFHTPDCCIVCDKLPEEWEIERGR